MWQDRVVFEKDVVVGKPFVKGTRITVDFVLDLLANGWSYDEISNNYPQLTEQDIRACLEYASSVIKDEKVLLI
jgi:uncharacterized protein (DUF433 family)